jgi:hypothetical protein
MGIKPTTVSLYNMSHNPVYQINYSNVAIGKNIASTKRKVQWKFGISDGKAIVMGKNGAECRGDEHEVVMIWSITSCKCNILYDNKEVYVMISKRMEMSIEAAWAIEGTGHIMKVIAHAVKPFSAEAGKFRQFDLQLDGMSFFDMPQIYELGQKKSSHHQRTTLPMKGIENRPTIKRTNEFTEDDLNESSTGYVPAICEDNRKMIVRKESNISQTRSVAVEGKKAPAMVDLLDFSDPPTMSSNSARLPYKSSNGTNAEPSHSDQFLASTQLALMNVPLGPNFAIPPINDNVRNNPFGVPTLTPNDLRSFSRYSYQQNPSTIHDTYYMPQTEVNGRHNAQSPILSNTLVLYDHQRSYNCGPTYETGKNAMRPIHASNNCAQLNWY